MPHPLLQHQRFQHDCCVRDTREGTSHQKMGQGPFLVTEPHAELNAGFVGLFASGHSAIFNCAETKNLDEGEFEARGAQTADFLTSAQWKLVSQNLCRRLSSHELSRILARGGYKRDLHSAQFGFLTQKVESFPEGSHRVQHVLLAQTKIGFLTGGEDILSWRQAISTRRGIRSSYTGSHQSPTLLFHYVPTWHERNHWSRHRSGLPTTWGRNLWWAFHRQLPASGTESQKSSSSKRWCELSGLPVFGNCQDRRVPSSCVSNHEPEAIAAGLRRLHLDGRPQPERRSISTSRSLGYGMIGVSALHRYRFAIRKNGDAAMSLAVGLTTLTNRFSWYGRREPETMVFVWKLGLVGVDLLDDGVRGVLTWCFFVLFGYGENRQPLFALKKTSLGSVLDCVAPCLEESLLSLAKLRLEVWKSFTEHTKCVVWLKNDSEKGP